MKLKKFSQALDFLYSYIPKTKEQTYSGDWGLARTKFLLDLLGSPQNKLKVIHLAGTSGKGSTATLLSLILKSLGHKVGLTLSPHLIDIRERVQINNALIRGQKFTSYLNKIIPAIQQVEKSKFGKPTYFELVTILAFYIFYKEKVDFAVVETGLGGLYDATNCIDNPSKIAVLTKIGLDHTNILGKTLTEIAQQKAGIIKPNNKVFSIEQEKEAERVLDKVAPITYLTKENFHTVQLSAKSTSFNFHYQTLNLANLELNLLGEHQVQNASLALAVSYSLSKEYHFKFNKQKIRDVLKLASFPGRFQIIEVRGKKVILDGAHNPQKMLSFLQSLAKIFPHQKFNFLVAFKSEKDYLKILRQVKPLANKIFITNFFTDKFDLIQFSEDSYKVSKTLNKLGFMSWKVIQPNSQALKEALQQKEDLVITGSLYLLAELYPQLKKYV